MPAWGSIWSLLTGADAEIERLLRGGDEVAFWSPAPESDDPLPGPYAASAIRAAAREITYKLDEVLGGDRLTGDLQADLKTVISGLGLPGRNQGYVVRPLVFGADALAAALIHGEGITDKTYIQQSILDPLISATDAAVSDLADIEARLVTANHVQRQSRVTHLVDGISGGKAILLVAGITEALVVETKSYPTRSVERAQNEPIVRGPQEAFVEDSETNVAMVRKHLLDRNLVTEKLRLGKRSRSEVILLYIQDVAAPDLVAEVRRRVASAKRLEWVTSGILEHLVEDAPNSMYPQVLTTERPDRVVSFLVEGHVAVIADGDPWALILPTSVWTMLHTSEDSYLRWSYSSFVRGIRAVAVGLTALTPGFYVAAVTYHPEMIPSPLVISIAAARERVPFPTLVEAVSMGLAFELIREAGLRIPSAIGPTIGIVGALILGQAAVQASLVSPTMVIVTAVTGLASFAIPNYSLGNTLRVAVWLFLAAGATLGFVGIATVMFGHLIYLSALKSVGRPFLAPAAPFRGTSRDVMAMFPYTEQERRPFQVGSQQPRRQPKVVRAWQHVGGGGAGRGTRSGPQRGGRG